jgi:hypothetical protein
MLATEPIYVCVPDGVHLIVGNVVLRQSTKVSPLDFVRMSSGIVVASGPRLAFDLARDLSPLDHASVVEQLIQRKMCTMGTLGATARRLCHPTRPGSERFARTLIARGDRPASESHPEVVLGEALVEVPRLVACGGAVVMALALFAFLRSTDVGKAIRALAEEPEGALLMGIDVRRIRAVAFGIGSGCVAVAGALVTPFFYVAPDVGESFNIMAFVVVVLGGMGNFVGALAGGFIVGLAESLGAAFLPGSLKLLVVFAIFILVLLFRPQGLFGGSRER